MPEIEPANPELKELNLNNSVLTPFVVPCTHTCAPLSNLLAGKILSNNKHSDTLHTFSFSVHQGIQFLSIHNCYRIDRGKSEPSS